MRWRFQVAVSPVSIPFLQSRVQRATATRTARKLGPGLAASRGMARSAVRVPEALQEHRELVTASVTPHLFVHEGARQRLERCMTRLLQRRLRLVITDNRRTMVSARELEGELEVRVHHMFLDADPFTQQALARYIDSRDRNASTVVGQYIDANRQRIRAPIRREPRLRTEGRKHDLRAMFGRLNDRYFQGMVDCSVTWGRRTRPAVGRRRRAIKLGIYCSDQKLIRIHPALDQDWVPRYFVEYIVFHEMLHHMTPMPMRDGRRVVHSAEFRETERLYPYYLRAIRWEQAHIGRLLGAR